MRAATWTRWPAAWAERLIGLFGWVPEPYARTDERGLGIDYRWVRES